VTLNPFNYKAVHLERLPQRTPYPAQLARILVIKSQLPREAQLIIDASGVGKGLFDLAVEHHLDPIGVIIHGGYEVHRRPHDRVLTVPKMRLIAELTKRLHLNDLFVPKSAKEGLPLRRELLNFRPEITRSGVETWNARSGEHDDLVMALCLALFQLTGEHVPYRDLFRYLANQAGDPAANEEWAVGVDVAQNNDYCAIAVVLKTANPADLTNHEAA
jgi:hypothetical protein